MEAPVKEPLLLDTDVLVDVLRNFLPTVPLLSKLNAEKHLHVSLLTEMELVAGCRNKSDVERTSRFLQRFERFTPCEASLQRAKQLIYAHRLEHGLYLPDAIIAGTAIQNNMPLLTRNLKHFRFIDELALYNFNSTVPSPEE